MSTNPAVPLKQRFHLRLFGNTLGLRVNVLHRLHDLLRSARRVLLPAGAPSPSPEAAEHARTVRSEGFACIRPDSAVEVVARLRPELDRLYEGSEGVGRGLEDSGLIRLEDPLLRLPGLEELLFSPAILEVVSAFHRSPFRLFSCEVYRTVPPTGEVNEGFNAARWHADMAPPNNLKVMVYLGDVSADSGPFTVVPRSRSQEILARGYWDENRREGTSEAASALRAEIEAAAVPLLGAAGTVTAFTPQWILHRAQFPVRGRRDVVVARYLPCLRQPEALDDDRRREIGRNRGYLINPFSDRPVNRSAAD